MALVREKYCYKAGIFFIPCLIFLLLPTVIYAAAWTLPEGKGQAITSFSFYQSSRFVNASGKRSPQPRFRKLELSPYVEYGWKEKLTLGGSARLASAAEENDGSDYALSEVEFFFRQLLLEKDHWVVSYQPLVKISGIYDKNATLSGSRTTDLELRFLAAWQLAPAKPYVNTEIAYRLRGSVADEWHADVTLGIPVTEKTQMLLQGFGTFALDTPTGSNTASVLSSSNYRLMKAQGSIVHHLSSTIALQVGVTSDIWGRNTGLGQGVFTALWYRF